MLAKTTPIAYFFERSEEKNTENTENTTTIDKKVGEKYIVHGWVRTIRNQNDLCFFQLNDGSHAESIQVVVDKTSKDVDTETETETEPKPEIIDTITPGSYIKVVGQLVNSPAQGQKYELQLHSIHQLHTTDPVLYPIKKNVRLDALRDYAHLRSRTKIFGCIFRIRNTLMYETHRFFQEQYPKFLNIDPNIITINECEGGAGVFTVTEMMNDSTRDIPNKNGVIQYTKDHFKQHAFLTVSSQLQLEALACGIGNVYTMNKSFRSEHSHTNKHVSEFTHLEIEMIDVKNGDLMDIGEAYIRHCIGKIYETHKDTDLKELDSFACKGILERYRDFLQLKFVRISYTEAIDILKENGYNIAYGEDLSSETENFLTKYFNGAVFVYDWEYKIKSFYMKRSRKDGETTCENFDLLMPYGIGELIGGSMREYDYKMLVENMREKGVREKGLEWYLDLRRFGTVEHGGFGLGMDRLLMMLTGIQNIKDVIPFPVYYENCKF